MQPAVCAVPAALQSPAAAPAWRCRSTTARKRLAVPFRAAHTPAERSEFAQPDVAVLLTHISYYSDGLSQEQLQQALVHLQGMGQSAREDIYASWLSLLPPSAATDGAAHLLVLQLLLVLVCCCGSCSLCHLTDCRVLPPCRGARTV